MTLPPGARVGPYEVLAFVGAGGMGQVYRVRDERLQRTVALKILSPDLAGQPERLRQFQREALALAALNHPNIAHVYGIESAALPDGTAADALIMEFVQGETLQDRIARGALRWAAAAPLVGQLVDALDASHSAGIVHRDLKPGNICVTDDGAIKVIDFGLAKPTAAMLAETETQSATAGAGQIVGTVRYMSPEQARGGTVDKRTDIWAFGCVVFELLTGRPAFAGATWTDTIVQIVEKEPDWSALPPVTPAGVVALVHHCLAKEPKARLRDIADARAHLERDVVSTPSSPPVRSRWSLAPWAIAAGLAVALVVREGGAPAPSSAAPAPEYARATLLTAGPANEMGPVLSPDGQWVAYLTNDGGATHLMVRYVAGGESVDLTASSGLQLPTRIDIGGPAISPDGSLIAFDAGAAPGTPSNLFDAWVVPAPLGGIPRKLVERGRGVRWSPDGTRIAYVRAGAAAGDSIYIANADGSAERQVLPTRGGMHAHWIQWAHDGSAIYFTYSPSTANSEPTQIFRVPAGGGEVEAVVQTARRAAFPVALPGGLIYAANSETSELGLWWQSRDGTATRRLTSGLGEYAEPSVSRDGSRLVATSVRWDQSLVAVDVAGAGPPTPVFSASSGDLDPTVSPDGSRIVFSSTRAGNRTLWSFTRADGHIRPLTSGNVFDERPSFSPDGTRLAFVSDRGGRRGIWVMSRDGGAPRQVATADVLDAVSWSPDGTRLVFAAPAGTAPGLYVVDVATGTSQALQTPGPATSPSWCGGRDVIAYVEARAAAADQPNSSRLAAVTSAGAPADLGVGASPNVLNGFVSCSTDGRTVLVVIDPGASPSAIWTASVDRGTPFQRVHEAPPNVRFRGVSWVPGGATVVVGRIVRSSDVVLFERVDDAEAGGR